MNRAAIIDSTEVYRYALVREWDEALPRVCFVMLNPSVADAVTDDPTVRRCMSFARRWGMGSIEVVNLYAYRATSPRALWFASDPVGPENDRYIDVAATRAAVVVAAWGAHGTHGGRYAAVLCRLNAPRCLGLTLSGQPRHPLYVRGDTPLIGLDDPDHFDRDRRSCIGDSDRR